jgi:[acyl-carrier-protein] S-malonyltransferase
MIARARELGKAAEDVACRAAAVLGEDASRYLEPRGARLDTNRDVQIAVFLATQMHLAALDAAGIDAEVSVGLSLGEYSHLVHIGALTFADALRLIVTRGTLYTTATSGRMVTIIGADTEAVEGVVSEARVHGVLAISNFNTPTQHVVAGSHGAVTWAARQLEERHGAMTIVIEKDVPMHSPLMADVANAFRPTLTAAAWRTPVRSYWSNVLGDVVPYPSPADFAALLTAHVSQPVFWRHAVERLAAETADAVFVEVGPGQVLHNMLGRRWIGPARACTDGWDAHPAAHFEAVIERLDA